MGGGVRVPRVPNGLGAGNNIFYEHRLHDLIVREAVARVSFL